MGIELDLNTADPEQLAKVFNQLESGEELQAADPTPTEPEKTAQAEQSQEQQQQPEQKPEDKSGESQSEPEGIATKDGKHVIPYSVLKSERERASRAEQMVREMQERLQALEQQAKPGEAGAKNDGESARATTESAVPEISPEDLELLKEDFPTVYKTVMASMNAIKAIEDKLKPVVESVQEQTESRERTVAEQVQDAIDSIPKLSHIQSSDKEAFALAKQFDATLRQDANWASKPLQERFEKVVELVEGVRGAIEVPGKTPKAQPKPEDLKNAAKAKAVQEAAASKTVPTSLSEFPAGQAPEANEADQVESMTPLQLAAKFASMTPDQLDAYFRSM